jgi:hypothetical protein
MKPSAKRRVEWRDPIVAEVRTARQALFAAAGHDIREFCRRARVAQETSGHDIVVRRPGRATTLRVGLTRRQRTKTG